MIYTQCFFEGGYSGTDVRTFWRKKIQICRNLWCFRMDMGGGGGGGGGGGFLGSIKSQNNTNYSTILLL